MANPTLELSPSSPIFAFIQGSAFVPLWIYNWSNYWQQQQQLASTEALIQPKVLQESLPVGLLRNLQLEKQIFITKRHSMFSLELRSSDSSLQKKN